MSKGCLTNDYDTSNIYILVCSNLCKVICMNNVKTIAVLFFGMMLMLTTALMSFANDVPEFTRVLITPHSDASNVRALVGIHHEFGRSFSADVRPEQVSRLKKEAAVEELPAYHILGKPSSNVRTCTPSSRTPWGVSRVNGGSGGAGVKVAVLDTGVNSHRDLKVSLCKDATRSGIQNGCKDGNGHGTHVAGTIAANGGSDNLGIFGVAPEATLLAVKVCGSSGSCWSDDIAAAIRYASDQGANIISMSRGSDAENSLIRDAIDYAVSKGVLIVAAAGNDGPDFGSIDYPGANPNVVAVAAIDVNNNVASWSSRGVNDGDFTIEAREVELSAPGVSVESTWNNGCYNTISGTSMATPHVSGLAAKLWQGSASATRTYLHELAMLNDLDAAGDDPAAGFGLPVAP